LWLSDRQLFDSQYLRSSQLIEANCSRGSHSISLLI
jgi:hypothetical protein